MSGGMSSVTRGELVRVSRMNGVSTAPVSEVLLACDEFTASLVQSVVGGRSSGERAEALCALLWRFGVGSLVSGPLN